MSNLAFYVDNLSERAEDNAQIDCIYTNLSKSFDLLDLRLLNLKEKLNSFIGYLFSWLKLYLVDRKLKMVTSGSESLKFQAWTGIPQGSHLWPTLFYMSNSNIFEHFHHSDCLQAYGLTFYRASMTIKDSRLLQDDLKRHGENNMALNYTKCYQHAFERKARTSSS